MGPNKPPLPLSLCEFTHHLSRANLSQKMVQSLPHGPAKAHKIITQKTFLHPIFSTLNHHIKHIWLLTLMPLCSACFSVLNIAEPVALFVIHGKMQTSISLLWAYGSSPSPVPPSEAMGLSPVPPPPHREAMGPPPPPREAMGPCLCWLTLAKGLYEVLHSAVQQHRSPTHPVKQQKAMVPLPLLFPPMRQWAHASWPWPKDLMRFQTVLVYCRHSLINWWDFSELVGSTSGRWGR